MFNINEDKFVAKLTRISDGRKVEIEVEVEVEADSLIDAKHKFNDLDGFCNPTFIHKKTIFDEI